MKLSTFDRSLIRDYMESDSALLNVGIAYVKKINPSASDAVAKETAIRMAQDAAYQKWYYDSTGYIDSEYKAFYEVREKLFNNGLKKSSYSSGGLSDASIAEIVQNAVHGVNEEKLKEERKRESELRAYCEKNNLDFETENKRYKREMAKLWSRACMIEFILQIVAICLLVVSVPVFIGLLFLGVDWVQSLISSGIVAVIGGILYFIQDMGLITDHSKGKCYLSSEYED